MSLLDETSYSFSDPDGRALFDALVDLYRADRAESLALRAGVPVTTINFRTSAVDAWQNLLPVAARSGKRGQATQGHSHGGFVRLGRAGVHHQLRRVKSQRPAVSLPELLAAPVPVQVAIRTDVHHDVIRV